MGIEQRPDMCGIRGACHVDPRSLSRQMRKVFKRARMSGNAKRFIIAPDGHKVQVPMYAKIKKGKANV